MTILPELWMMERCLEKNYEVRVKTGAIYLSCGALSRHFDLLETGRRVTIFHTFAQQILMSEM